MYNVLWSFHKPILVLRESTGIGVLGHPVPLEAGGVKGLAQGPNGDMITLPATGFKPTTI